MHLQLLSRLFNDKSQYIPLLGFNHLESFIFLSLECKCVLTHSLTWGLLTWFFLMYCWTACKLFPRSVCMASGSRSWTHAWRGYSEQVKERMHPQEPCISTTVLTTLSCHSLGTCLFSPLDSEPSIGRNGVCLCYLCDSSII